MPQEFEIKCKISDESVPGGLKVDATPKSYHLYRELFEAAREVRKIDDFRELRLPYYPAFSPFEYQREAVLTMLGRFRGKGIFGDQVGLGKTVEVGMTVAEYAERGAIKNVLLLCPRKLDFQWVQEMRDKFSEHFSVESVSSFEQMSEGKRTRGVKMYVMTFDVILSCIKKLRERMGADLKTAEEKVAAARYKIDAGESVAEAERELRRKKALYATLGGEVDENYLEVFDIYSRALPEINMLVVDEADALLSADPTKTLQIYRVAEHIARSPSVAYKILMSATPIRRQLADVYKLMKIVRPEQFGGMDDFIDNYCFGKSRLSDFKGDELRKLKGLIDQLFTRNRLTSRTVRQSLKPLTIKEVTYLNFNNFSSPDFEREVREAVKEAMCAALGEIDRKYFLENLGKFESEEFGSPDHWARYIRVKFFESDDPPFEVTEDTDRAFAASLYGRIARFKGAEADAVRFACENYVIPPKRGHRIAYKNKRNESGDQAFEDAVAERYVRKARIEGGFVSARDAASDLSDSSEIDCDSKFVEFDRLINELLPDRKVLVFSDTGDERKTFIKIVESVTEGRVLDGMGDDRNKKYLEFGSKSAKRKSAVYFAVNGEEKGFNMQFCSDLVITDLPHDPNLVEQIVGRISRIGQHENMNVYVFAPKGSLEYYLYTFYNDDLHLFSDWDGDNTFIIGGAVAAFLDENPDMHRELIERVGGKFSADGETLEIGFPQIVEYLWEKYDSGFVRGSFENFAPWENFRRNVRESIESFYALVREFGDQELYTAEDDVI